MSVKIKKYPKAALSESVPFPADDANKYTRGKLVAIGGCEAYPGAICLASKAAYLAGSGYVEVVCAPETLPIVRSFNSNVVARDWTGWTAGASKLDDVEPGHPVACLVGSGFDASDEVQSRLVLDVLENCRHAVVIDGGAITTLATDEGRACASRRYDAGFTTIVTPHFGEAARLGRPFKMRSPEHPAEHHDEDARFAQQLADAYGAVIVLKGPDTFIAQPHDVKKNKNDVVYMMDKGTSALAKAGTGDVLAGIVSGLASQGMCSIAAANLAANIHAQAGRIASEKIGEISVCATDVADSIPDAIGKFC